ncbi:MAG: heme exporter protein CcmB, partial [Candidatus Poribacteria bacterium]|nr:heme exporter protein CcmB [Candidatus Poribacteria bacterium]
SFAGIITLTRSIEIDRAYGGLDAVRLTGTAPSLIYLSKVVSNVIWLTLIQAAITPVALLFLEALDQVSWLSLLKLIAVLAMGTIGFCAVGVILATMSVRAGGESLLTVILFPLIFPVIMAGAKCTVSILTTSTIGNRFWISLLVTYSLVFLSCSYLLFEFVIEG